MAATWGEAEVQVHVDGSSLPEEVRAITSAAGNTGGKEFNKSFGQRVKEGMKDTFERIKGYFSNLWAKLFRRGGSNLGSETVKGFNNSLAKIKVGDKFMDPMRDSVKTFRLEFDEMSTDVVKRTTDIARRSTDVDFGRWADDLGRFRQIFPELTDGFQQLSIEGSKAAGIWEPMTEDIGELRQVFDDTSDSARRMGISFNRTGQLAITSGKAFEGYNDRVRGHNGIISRLRNQYDKLKRSWGEGGGMRGLLGRLSGAFDGMTAAGNRNRSMWKRLSANTRQWTLIIGAVVGAFGQLAGLASAAGAGLFVLGSVIGSLGVGLVGFLAIFSALNQELDDAPDNMKPLIREFQRFKKTIKDTGNEIASAAFDEMGGAFDSLSDTVKGLTTPLRKVGTVLGRLTSDFAKNVAPGTKAFGELSKFIDNSSVVLDRLIRAVGRFAGAVVEGFNKANPLTQSFLGWIDKLVDRFTAFVEGPGFDEWIDHAMDVFGPFGELLDTVGRLLNDMVTDKSIDQLVNFIDNIDRFLKGGGKGILDFAQNLDIFGLLSQALADLGDALEPLAGPMADLGEAFNIVLSTAIDTLAPIIADIAEAIAPLVQNLADFMKQNPEAFANALVAISVGFVAIKAVNILSTVVPGIAKFVGLASGKNTTKLAKFAGALGGLAVAWAGASATANAEGPGTEAAGGVLESILGGALTGAAAGSVIPILGTAIGAVIGAVGGLISNAITSMFSDTDNVWKQGWSQIFDPSDFSGAGIGVFKENIGMIPGIVEEGFANIQAAWEGFGQAWTDFWTGIGEGIATWWTGITTGFANWWAGIVEGWTGFWAQLGDPAFWNAIADAIGLWIAGIIIAFTDWLAGIFLGWNTFWATMNDPAFWNAIWDGLIVWWTGILDGITVWWESIVTGWTTFWDTLNDPKFWNAIWDAIVIWWDGILADFGTWWADIQRGWTTFWDTLNDPKFWNAIWDAITGWFGNIWSGFTGWWADVTSGWSNFWTGLSGTTDSKTGEIDGGLAGWWGDMTSGFGSFISDVQTNWNNFWGGLWTAVRDAVNNILGWVDRLLGPIRDALGALGDLVGAQASGNGPGAAAGRLVAGPQRILVGEDGPEAIVPLRRSLGRVNPAVRELSAIAQGKEVPGGTGFGSAGRVVNINEGAIVIQGARDPNADAVGVVNRIAERVAS